MPVEDGTGVGRRWGRRGGCHRDRMGTRDKGRGGHRAGPEPRGSRRGNPAGCGHQGPRKTRPPRTPTAPPRRVADGGAGSPPTPRHKPGAPGRLPRPPRARSRRQPYLAHPGQRSPGSRQRSVDVGGAGALRGRRRILLLRPEPPQPPQGHGRAAPPRAPLYNPRGAGPKANTPPLGENTPLPAPNHAPRGSKPRLKLRPLAVSPAPHGSMAREGTRGIRDDAAGTGRCSGGAGGDGGTREGL